MNYNNDKKSLQIEYRQFNIITNKNPWNDILKIDKHPWIWYIEK